MLIMDEVPNDHQLLEAIPDAVVVSDPDGSIVFVNRAAEAMTGYKRAELIGHKVEVLVPPRLRGIHVRHRRKFYDEPAKGLMGLGRGDLVIRRKDGKVTPVEISLGPAGENTVSVVRDVSERHRMQAALEHRALHDPLTDLANRTLFFDRLRQLIHAARRESTQFALVMLDLDGFKTINDIHGHAAGDATLRIVGERLRAGLRATDTAARIGGDEFAWLLPRVSSKRAVDQMVRKRLSSAQQPVVVDGTKLDIGVSAGIAMYPDDGRDPDSLMRHADASMYWSKRRRHLVNAT